MINTTLQPFIPDGWTIESHDSMGEIEHCFELYVDKTQAKGIEGNKLREIKNRHYS